MRSAAQTAGENVQVVEPGPTIGDFVLRSVTIDAVELTDPTGHAVTISLH
jgi:hypothetical protein